MSRFSFLNIIDTINSIDVDIYDLQIPWHKFPYYSGYTLHYISQEDIIKTENIPYKHYKNTDYDDIIMLLNNIDDPFNIPLGLQIKIPDKTELDKWIKEQVKLNQ